MSWKSVLKTIGEDVVLESIREHHDRVVGDGAANQCFHKNPQE